MPASNHCQVSSLAVFAAILFMVAICFTYLRPAMSPVRPTTATRQVRPLDDQHVTGVYTSARATMHPKRLQPMQGVP